MNLTNITYWVIGGVVVVALTLGAWFFFVTSPSTTLNTEGGSGFGVGDTRSITVLPSGSGENIPIASQTTSASQIIFKVANGPVTSATLIQTLHPTTTLARYVGQENGHAFDLVLDSAGIVPKTVSNTTIPGTVEGRFTEDGKGVILQYLEESLVKSVYVGFPTATNTPIKIQFLPDNVIDYSFSPDNKSVVYLIKTPAGSDGYRANVDGGGSKKLFSTPLSQVLISWPILGTMLLQTKSSAGVEGAIFSVNAMSGAVAPLVYGPGITATADRSFSNIVYQTIGSSISSYGHDTKTSKDRPLSFNPIPEKCVWSKTKGSVLYCALPLAYVEPSYLELWYQGSASAADAIFSFDIATGRSTILTIPGGEDGGVASDIKALFVSPDDKYLLFLKKGDRSLWGVRLGS